MHFFYYDSYDHTITLPWSSLSTLLSVCLIYAQAWKKLCKRTKFGKKWYSRFFLKILMDDRRQTRTHIKKVFWVTQMTLNILGFMKTAYVYI